MLHLSEHQIEALQYEIEELKERREENNVRSQNGWNTMTPYFDGQIAAYELLIECNEN